MNIYKALNLDIDSGGILSFVGAGGKTTTIFQLAKELKEKDKRVLITTTTKIGNPSNEDYDYFFLKSLPPFFKPKNSSATILGQELNNTKMVGISLDTLDELIKEKIFDFILIEADGANRKAVKAPASYEPVVSELTSKTIGIIGLDCLGKVIQEAVHRPEIFIEIVGKSLTDIVDEDAIFRLVISDTGLFKDAKGRKMLFMNKADKTNLEEGIRIRQVLLDKGFDGDIIIGDVIKKNFY